MHLSIGGWRIKTVPSRLTEVDLARLRRADAELAEMLQFLSGWLAHDPARLAASLEAFVGHLAYGTRQLREDLDRFTFLLAVTAAEPLFGP